MKFKEGRVYKCYHSRDFERVELEVMSAHDFMEKTGNLSGRKFSKKPDRIIIHYLNGRTNHTEGYKGWVVIDDIKSIDKYHYFEVNILTRLSVFLIKRFGGSR